MSSEPPSISERVSLFNADGSARTHDEILNAVAAGDVSDPSFITREVYDETRYTPEVRQIMDEHDQRRSARVQLAWLMWCYQEGYTKAEDREVMENWFGEHQDNAEDEQTRQDLLEMADEVLAALNRDMAATMEQQLLDNMRSSDA